MYNILETEYYHNIILYLYKQFRYNKHNIMYYIF